MNRFIIADPKLCIGCNTCMASCSAEHRQRGLQALPRLQVIRNARDSAPVMCHQCEDAPCAQVCPVNAIRHQDDAIVLNESLCVSCKLCGIACPFGAIGFGGSTPLAIPSDCNTPLALPTAKTPRPIGAFLDCVPGVRAVAVKCDLCAFTPLGPACIRTCPTQAIRLVSDHDVRNASEQKRRNAMQALSAELPFATAPESRKEPN
ncbi:4Fe-4S dicluster domain-containing protein [Serratia marcescens]|nr:4Fe-4S dicluster domain-containing protein [Serratia marcescens]